VVLTIGDEKITEAQFDELVNSLPEQYRQAARTMQKRQFAEQLVQVKLLAQDAEKNKLDQDPKIREALNFQRQNILAQAMFLDLQKGVKIDDAAVEKYYNEHKADYEVLKARHILIRVKGAPMQAKPGAPELSDEEALAKAQSIRKRLLAGEDFAAIAKKDSDDAGSAAQGGELGEFRKGMMVPPFEQAAFAAKVNEVTEPVKSPFGYHLIVVESHVTKTPADARSDIETKLRPQMARAEVDNLRKGATVKMDDAFFGAAAAPPSLALPTAPK
jgi:parvulin-like peptidyl-prolyl isomerase